MEDRLALAERKASEMRAELRAMYKDIRLLRKLVKSGSTGRARYAEISVAKQAEMENWKP